MPASAQGWRQQHQQQSVIQKWALVRWATLRDLLAHQRGPHQAPATPARKKKAATAHPSSASLLALGLVADCVAPTDATVRRAQWDVMDSEPRPVAPQATHRAGTMCGWCCHAADLRFTWWKPESHVRIKEDILEVHKVKVMPPPEQLHLEKKVLTASWTKYLLAHVVSKHFTLAAGASTADINVLFNGKIPTKVIIGLVSNEAFVGAWQKNPFNFTHMDLNSACLVVDGCPLPTQPWQPDFKWGLYAETYHSLLKSSGMYPSDWSNRMSAEQFEGGSMLLSWDLMPDDSDCVAYLSPRCLGLVKASLRFARPLPATTTLIAYAQYDNLVVIDTNHTVTFDYNAWCLAGNF